MHRFWDIIIEPVLEKLRPAGIVEIGCEYGKNTRNLVEFCVRHGATLFAIDPAPKFDVNAWEQQYGAHFVFYQSLSLNAIPLVERFDVVLIDGDHNWYTVFHELKLIEKRCQELGQPFPLVMLHDVGWPYGRRDLYYNPENIPEAYRKPYAKKGIRPGSPELADDGGLNPHLFNSIYENNFQNGVLTAVEDFIKETKQDLEFVYIPGYHGLGILVPAQLKESNQKLAEFVNSFTSPVMVKHVEKIEISRVEAEIKKNEQQAILRAKEAEVSDLRERLSESERVLAEIREQVVEVKSELDRERMTWQEERQRLEVERAEQREEVGRLREELEQQQAVLRAKEAEVVELRQRMDDKEHALAEKDRQLLEFKDKVNRQAQDIEKLTGWVEQMRAGVSRLLKSRRWKVGNALGELQRKMLFKRRQPMVTNSIENIYQDFQKWKVNRTGDSTTSFSIEQSSSSGSVSTSYDLTQLRHWLEQLEHGMNRLLRTRRWKIGNAIGFVSSVFHGSVKSPLASEHMREIFLQFRNWSPQLGNENSDIQKLARWIEQLQQDYEALLNSRRWKIGDRIVTFTNSLFIRKKGPMVTDHIEIIFSSFKGWQVKRTTLELDRRIESPTQAVSVEMDRERTARTRPRPDELMAALQRLDNSVAQRLAHIDVYKNQIAKYAAARATRNSQSKDQKRIVIYTAISGGYDSIKLPEQLDPRFDYVLFTDTPAPDTGVWQIRPITYFHEDVTRIARYVKTHPHLLLDDYDIAIWIDANIMILGDVYPLVEDFLASGKAVAAVPHPIRKSVYEEFEACIRQKKDDVKVMQEQLARYKCLGFENDDLIESNFMMFNLRDKRVRSFLDTWWAEIDRYSKRDQLSLNFALAQNGLEWHRLTRRPNSIRNHPVFAMVPHDNGKGPASKLVDALQVPLIDPYIGPPYADLRDKRIATQRHRRIDIVVCVHNALEEVKRCLESVRRARNSEYQKLIIIDDGSDQSTARYLEDFASSASWVELHRNENARGYTKAANQGLAASTGELVILLNSDTIVTDGWAEKMADAVFSTPGAGIVGPMSNAASHQSIPEHRGSKEQTAINELPPGLTAEDMNRYCEQWTVADVLPRVPLVHGFCFGVTREVINTIGLFDEDNFPKGYGEENDYCFRAVDAGFSLVVATHTYVFHAKSKSYPDSERVKLMKAGSEALERKYGRPRIHRAVRSMQENPFFVDLRQRARDLMKNNILPPIEVQDIGKGTTTNIKSDKRSILAIVPRQSNGYPEGSGYIRVVKPLQHAGLSGVIRLSLAGKDWGDLTKGFDALLIQRDAVKTSNQAEKIVDHCRKNKIRLIYEIDDDLLHLPETHSAAGRYSPAIREAMQTIIRHSDAVTVSTTPLKERLTVLNNNIFVIPNALDESLWLPAENPRWSTQRSQQVRILYMGTSTHDDDLALVGDAIKRLKEKYGDRVTFTCIGGFSKNAPEMARVLSVPKWASTYPEFAKWMARLSHHYDIAIAPLCDTEFNRCKSYIKYLDYGICGFAVVLSDVQPYRDVVRHGETGMLVENTTESWYEVLCTLIDDPGLRYNLGRNAREDIIEHHTLAAQAEQRRRIWSEILS